MSSETDAEARLLEWIENAGRSFDSRRPEIDRGLNEALHAFSERGLLPDDVSVSPEQARVIWAIVETLRVRPEFPTDLRM